MFIAFYPEGYGAGIFLIVGIVLLIVGAVLLPKQNRIKQAGKMPIGVYISTLITVFTAVVLGFLAFLTIGLSGFYLGPYGAISDYAYAFNLGIGFTVFATLGSMLSAMTFNRMPSNPFGLPF
jgi:hypothetical protein